MTKYLVEKYNASDDTFLVLAIEVKSGTEVKKGDFLFTLETSKAAIEIESEKDGYIYYQFEIGSKVLVNDLFYIISEKQESEIQNEFNITANNNSDHGNYLISAKASKLLIHHNINASLLKKNVIKEADVLDYLKTVKTPISLISESHLEILQSKRTSKDIVIIGAKGGGKMSIDAITSRGDYNIVGLLDDAIPQGEKVFGHEVLGSLENIEQLIKIGISSFVIAFGVIENRTARYNLYITIKEKGGIFPNIIHRQAIVESSVQMGEGNIILAGANVGSAAVLGDLNYINNSALVSHDCILDNNIHVAPGAVMASSIQVESNVLIGMNATLFYGLKIGKNATINNGLIINKDVPANAQIKNNF